MGVNRPGEGWDPRYDPLVRPPAGIVGPSNGQVISRRVGLLPAMEGWAYMPAVDGFVCPDCGCWGVTVSFLVDLHPARRDEANAHVEEHPCLRLYWLGALEGL